MAREDDDSDAWKDLRAYHRAIRVAQGMECPVCRELRPKTNPTILLPGQRCKVDGYRDPRAQLTEDQRRAACDAAGAPYFERDRS